MGKGTTMDSDNGGASAANIRATVDVTVRRKVILEVPVTKWPSRIAQTIQERVTADGDEVVEFHYVEWERVDSGRKTLHNDGRRTDPERCDSCGKPLDILGSCTGSCDPNDPRD